MSDKNSFVKGDTGFIKKMIKGKQLSEEQKIIYDFYIMALARFTFADRKIGYEEKIQIKTFIRKEIRKEYQEYYYKKYLKILKQGVDRKKYKNLVNYLLESDLFGVPQRKRFINYLAQIAKAKSGELNPKDYQEIIKIGEDIGIEDIETNNVIKSIFNITDTFIIIIGVFCVGFTLYFAKTLFILLFASYFISRIIISNANILNKFIFNKLKIPVFSNDRVRVSVGKIISILFVFFIIILLTGIGIESSKNIINNFAPYQEKITDVFEKTKIFLSEKLNLEAEELLLPAIEKIPFKEVVFSVFGGIMDILNTLGYLLLTFIFSVYFVFSKSTQKGVFSELDQKITRYITVKFFISLLTGISFYLTCLLFGLEFALFWGFLAFILNFIPSIGSIIATIPPIVLSIFSLPLSQVFLATLIFVGVQNFYGNVLDPNLMGRSLKLRPITVLAGLVLWGTLWGVAGMLMSALLMAMIKLILDYYSFNTNLGSYL